MTENRLNDDVLSSQPVKIRRQSAATCMPPVPRDPCLGERRLDHLARHVVEISATPFHSLEQVFLRAKRGDVSVEDLSEPRDHGHSSLTSLSLRYSNLLSPNASLYEESCAC